MNSYVPKYRRVSHTFGSVNSEAPDKLTLTVPVTWMGARQVNIVSFTNVAVVLNSPASSENMHNVLYSQPVRSIIGKNR